MSNQQTNNELGSAGVYAGRRIADIFADIEYVLIRNRRELLRQASEAKDRYGGFYRNAVTAGVAALTDFNIEQTAPLLAEAREMLTAEMVAKYNQGIAVAEKTVEEYKTQGFEPKTEQSAKAAMQSMEFRSNLNTSLSRIATLVAVAIFTAGTTASMIASMSPSGDLEEIDRLQLSILDDGFRHDGRKDMVGESEFIMRNDGHRAFLAANGERSQELGLPPLVMISAHPSSCELCMPWQGQIVIDDVYQGGQPDGQHALLSEAIADGFLHWNCRHEYTSYIEGLNKPDIFESERQPDRENLATYAVEQNQRYNERHIRQFKARAEGALTEDARKSAEAKVREWQLRQRELEKYADNRNIPFYRQYNREQIGGATLPRFRL